MQIFINGKELQATLENEKNAFEVLKPIEEWCNSNFFLINKVIIDDKEYSSEIDEEYTNISIDTISKIEIEALTHSEYYLSSLLSIIEYINIIAKTISLESSDIDNLKDGLSWILDSLPRAIFLCNMNLETYNILHILKMIEVKLERLNTLTDNNADIKSIQDFFETDIKSFIIEKVIPTMEVVLEDAKINTIIIFANNITKENSLYKIGTLPTFLPLIQEILDKVVSKLQTGNDKDAFLYAEKFSRIVEFTFSIISTVADVYSLDYSDISFNNTNLKDYIADFNDMMNNVLDAFSNEDYISIADLLEYEIKDRIENIMNYIPEIEKHIEKLNV